MTEITLADYTGYIFLEIIKARKLADAYSRQLAQDYAGDPVLKFFSVPRFKIPKMELTIPVLISGARFNQVVTFKMPLDKFFAYVIGRVLEVVSTVRARGREVLGRPDPPCVTGPSIDKLAEEFWTRLENNPDPTQPGTIVREMWTRIFEQALTEQNLIEIYKRIDPKGELFTQSLDDVLKKVTTGTVIDSTAIESLLINPETNVVKNGSSDASVFTIKADMMEEGFFIRSIRDEDTGQVSPIVEFE